MPEHTPAPTPHRAVYGFAVFLLFKTLFLIWLICAFVPDYILRDKFGLTYLPDKYFAIQLPVITLCGLFFFAFFIYPSCNLSMAVDCDNISVITDKYSIRRCKFLLKNGKSCERRIIYDGNIEYNVTKHCAYHQNKFNSIDGNDVKISNFCDCPNKTKCFWFKKPYHVQMLLQRKTVPSISDLDVSQVCKKIFRHDKL